MFLWGSIGALVSIKYLITFWASFFSISSYLFSKMTNHSPIFYVDAIVALSLKVGTTKGVTKGKGLVVLMYHLHHSSTSLSIAFPLDAIVPFLWVDEARE